ASEEASRHLRRLACYSSNSSWIAARAQSRYHAITHSALYEWDSAISAYFGASSFSLIGRETYPCAVFTILAGNPAGGPWRYRMVCSSTSSICAVCGFLPPKSSSTCIDPPPMGAKFDLRLPTTTYFER